MIEDFKHLNLIREKLWEGKEYGKVSIMVGAGLSKNAQKRNPQVFDFPLWKDLAVLMYKKLYISKNIGENTNTLEIASEFEVEFGKQGLDNFILENIPDEDYFPSDLHKLLLNLPWADIFTTNYDTLLERTSPYVYMRKYDVVLTKHDILRSKQPIIVKLHGTLPSIKPFIITEEDYRTYPVKFAPFVNMVQQSLMENTFCLIGFSANDPNFLNWIGWIKDNFDKSMPKIYLIDILDISESRKKYFESKNIVTVDLSQIFPQNQHSSDRHYKAIEWLLWYLIEGIPIDKSNWPDIKKVVFPLNISKSRDLPDIPQNSDAYVEQKLHPIPKSRKDKNEIKGELDLILEQWEQIRENYPGWIVLPPENIRILWLYTDQWIEFILHNLDKIDEPSDLFLLYELNWRLEKCLIPLFINQYKKYTEIIQKYNPFPDSVSLKAIFTPSSQTGWDWENISKKWINLVFAVMRESREDLDEERFSYWSDLIKEIVSKDYSWKSRWYYENTLFNFMKFDINKVKNILRKWPQNEDYPEWELRRAAILTELGNTEKAKDILKKILYEVRNKEKARDENFYLFSLEGWIILLLNTVNQNKLFYRQETENLHENFIGRMIYLDQYKSNPWMIIEYFKNKIVTEKKILKPEKEIKKKFDPGEEEITHHFGFNQLDQILPAFQFLRLFEVGGIPYTFGNINMHKETVTKAAQWIKSFAPFWALSSFIRSGENKEDEVDKWFSRIIIASLSQEEIKKFSSIFIPAWKQSIEEVQRVSLSLLDNTIYQRVFKILTEIVSRFLFRLNDEKKKEILNIALVIQKSNILETRIFYNYLGNFWKRLLLATREEDILSNMNELLSLPVVDYDFQARDTEYLEPLFFLEWFYTKRLPDKFDRSSWDIPIRKLIEIIEKYSSKAREIAILRLFKINRINGLTDEEKSYFAKALWSKTDDKFHLPIETGLYTFGLLKLPSLSEVNNIDLIKKWLLNSASSKKINSFPNNNIKNYLFTLIEFVKNNKFSNKELFNILGKLNDFVGAVCTNYSKFQDSPFGDLYDIINSIKYVKIILNEVIYPNINHGAGFDETKDLIKQIIEKLKSIKIPVLSVKPGMLIFYENKYDEIISDFRRSLVSRKEEEIRDALEGIYSWLFLESKCIDFSPINKTLINELFNKILNRREPGLLNSISITSRILDHYPDKFTEEQVNILCEALEFLLEECEIPKPTEIESIVDRNILELSKETSRLALSIKNWLGNIKKEPPWIIKEWEKRAKSDFLPEVWKIWE